MAVKVITISNFPFASAKISPAQDRKIQNVAALLRGGKPPVPPVTGLDEVVIIGHGRGSRPKKWADKRAAAVTERLIELLKKKPAVKVADRLKISSGFSQGKVTSRKASKGADRKVEIQLEWRPGKPKKKKAKKKTVKALKKIRGKELKGFVWAVTGDPPKKMTTAQLVKEFAEFTDVVKFLKKPSYVTAAKAFAKTFKNLVFEVFGAKSEAKLGALVGSSYAIMDVACGLKRRKTPTAKTAGQKKFSSGFGAGYGKMYTHLKKLIRTKSRGPSPAGEELKRLLDRLKVAKNDKAADGRSIPLGTIYTALHEALVPKLRNRGEQIFFSTKRRGWFAYPRFKVDNKKWR